MESAFGYDITNNRTNVRANNSNGAIDEESPKTDKFPKGLDTNIVQNSDKGKGNMDKQNSVLANLPAPVIFCTLYNAYFNY